MTLLSYAAFASKYSVARGTVKRWVHEGMPTVRLDRAVRLDEATAVAWVFTRRQRSIALGRCSVVYFARNDAGEVKIGFSSDTARRSGELGAEVIAQVAGGRALEQLLHRHFADAAMGGEWFLPVPDLLALIEVLRCR